MGGAASTGPVWARCARASLSSRCSVSPGRPGTERGGELLAGLRVVCDRPKLPGNVTRVRVPFELGRCLLGHSSAYDGRLSTVSICTTRDTVDASTRRRAARRRTRTTAIGCRRHPPYLAQRRADASAVRSGAGEHGRHSRDVPSPMDERWRLRSCESIRISDAAEQADATGITPRVCRTFPLPNRSRTLRRCVRGSPRAPPVRLGRDRPAHRRSVRPCSNWAPQSRLASASRPESLADRCKGGLRLGPSRSRTPGTDRGR